MGLIGLAPLACGAFARWPTSLRITLVTLSLAEVGQAGECYLLYRCPSADFSIILKSVSVYCSGYVRPERQVSSIVILACPRVHAEALDPKGDHSAGFTRVYGYGPYQLLPYSMVGSLPTFPIQSCGSLIFVIHHSRHRPEVSHCFFQMFPSFDMSHHDARLYRLTHDSAILKGSMVPSIVSGVVIMLIIAQAGR